MKKRILIVEDDAILAEDVKISLERLGYQVADSASSGEEAIKKAALLKPDLVLMDIILRGQVDGIKAAAHIINQYDIPVVYLTSHSDRATIKRARETGPFGYLMKPFDEKDMAATLEMALYKHATERRLKQSEQWLSIILKGIGDAVLVMDAHGRLSFLNPTAERMLGQSSEDILGKPFSEVCVLYSETEKAQLPLGPADVSGLAPGASYILPGSIVLHTTAAEIPVKGNASALRNDQSDLTGMVLVLSDETEQRRAIKMIEKSERFLSTIFDSIQDPFCIFDKSMKMVRANEPYSKLRGMKSSQILGKTCKELCRADERPCPECIVERTAVTLRPATHEREVRLPDGTQGWMEVFTYPIFDNEGKATHIIEHMRDISSRRKYDDERRRLILELEHLSRIDPLSGLLNRRALMDFVAQEVDRAKRYKRSLSLMLCDIDRFKEINDTFGHRAGDEAIEKISAIMKGMVRKTDVVGRYGGDEIMIVMPETKLPGAEEFAERVRQTVEAAPFNPTRAESARLTLSIGVSTLKAASDSIDSLITRADAGLYEAKRLGRNRVTSVK